MSANYGMRINDSAGRTLFDMQSHSGLMVGHVVVPNTTFSQTLTFPELVGEQLKCVYFRGVPSGGFSAANEPPAYSVSYPSGVPTVTVSVVGSSWARGSGGNLFIFCA